MVTSPRQQIEAAAGTKIVFNVEIRTENIAGDKGVESAIGWFDGLGKNIGWSESKLLKGTNDWMTLRVVGEIPENSVEMTLVPIRIFRFRGCRRKSVDR